MSEHEPARIELDGEFQKLVATRHIYQGETIVTLPLIALDSPDKYSIEATPGLHIDCRGSLAGAINHSCKPNAAVRLFRVVAFQCIQENEEITINYLKTEHDMAAPFRCNCCGTVIRGNKYE